LPIKSLTQRALGRTALRLGAAALTAGTLVGGLAAAASATPAPPTMSATRAVSAVTVASPVSPSAHLQPVPIKPHVSPPLRTRTIVIPKPVRLPTCAPICIFHWSVAISANPHLLWGTQSSTVTATANMNVGPTPYWLGIYNINTGTFVAECGTGSTCSAVVSEPGPNYQSYQAVVGPFHALPFSHAALASAGGAAGGVEWQDVGPVTLTSSAGSTLGLGGLTTLTASTLLNVGPTPFYIQIFDATTGTRLTDCAFGTSCSAAVSQFSAATHRYIAYVSDFGAAFPPPAIQDTSSSVFVTWASTGWRISLNAVDIARNVTAIANTNMNVGPTPYYIEIFNENGTLLHECASGTSCTASFFLPSGNANLVAFVSSLGSSLPPPNTQASSNVVAVP
jgi:hypothetical protein